MPQKNTVQMPQELVQIVDEDNNATGKATRAQMRAENLIHRCSFTIVQNSEVCSFCDCRYFACQARAVKI